MNISEVNIEYNKNIKKGEQFLKNKDFDEALKCYEKSSVLKPTEEEPMIKIDKLKKLQIIRRKISEVQSSFAFNKAFQMALKIVLNATYGAFANPYFVLSNSKIANAITIMGRNLINYMAYSVDDYFYNHWIDDKETHKLLGLEYIVKNKVDGLYYFLDRNFDKVDRGYSEFNTGHNNDILMSRRITKEKLVDHLDLEDLPDYDILYEYKIHDFKNVKSLDLNPTWEKEEETGYTLYNGKNPVVRYQDTDSVEKNTTIITDKCETTIEEFYNRNIINGSGGITSNGHESVITDEKSLNWSEEKKLYYSNIKRIKRHKVSKPKWKLRTKTGQEIIITSDHSLVVFRNGIKTKTKPDKIEKDDKILIIYNDKMYLDI